MTKLSIYQLVGQDAIQTYLLQTTRNTDRQTDILLLYSKELYIHNAKSICKLEGQAALQTYLL